MPTYDYKCKSCGSIEEVFQVPYEIRMESKCCHICSGVSEYKETITRNFWSPKDEYDEGLGCDIHGRRHRQQVMKSQGVEEVGDKIGGERNFDEGYSVKAMKPRGVKHSDRQKIEEREFIRKEKTEIGIIKNGTEIRTTQHGNLSSDVSKAFTVKHTH